ncbi:TAF6L factor, partial [Nothocercus julius]|nr:TAF6L factor [Nothocercus julius]
MAEAAGLELSDEVAALLAEDVCYRLREATQNSSQFLKHTRRRRLTAEDFNRALRWSNVEVSGGGGTGSGSGTEAALGCGTNVTGPGSGWAAAAPSQHHPLPAVHVSYLDGKGNVEPQGAVPSAVSALSDDLLKYYQLVTRAVLGDDPQLMKVALQDLRSNSKIAALLPYFVYVVSGVS